MLFSSLKEILLDDFAVAFAECACCVGFVRVNVHCSCELRAYTYNNVTENGGSAVGFDLYGYDFLVGYAEFFCISRGEVDVTLCCDNAFCDFNFAAGTYELACAGTSYVTGFTYGCGYAEGTCVGEGDFNLGCRTCRTKDDYVRDGLLRANNGNAFFACELTGLGQILLVGESCAFAEQDLDVFFRKMYVTCAGFN